MYLLMRTEQEEAYVALVKDYEHVAEKSWQAHRELSDTLLKTIEDLLTGQSADWKDVDGIGIFKGPGSFTGLRVGATVANTLASSLSVNVVGVNGDNWQHEAIEKLDNKENDRIVVPEYGGEANITKPRK